MPAPKMKMTADDYWNLPDVERAELIDGELWNLAAPSRTHQHIQMQIGRTVANFIDSHHGSCQVYGSPFAVNLFADDTTFVEPDVSVICDRSKLSNRGCEGAPDLVIEIVSPSSQGMDYVTKPNLYMRAGVREYLIVDPTESRTIAYRFEEDPSPVIYSFAEPVPFKVLPGLELNIADILKTL